MIVFPGPLMIAGLLAIFLFFYFKKRATNRKNEHSERLGRMRQYYDALMERRKNNISDQDDPVKNDPHSNQEGSFL
jgi:hypothetical protein